jgi:hypothetical protein
VFIVHGDDSCDYNNDDDKDDDDDIIQVMTKTTHIVYDTNWRICSMVFDTVHRNIIFVCIVPQILVPRNLSVGSSWEWVVPSPTPTP